MKILLVVHYYLPGHQAGTEIYASLLAREFARRGHEVVVFTSEDAPLPPGKFEIIKDDWRGPVYRLRRGEPAGFKESYADPEIDALFRDFLLEQKPDLVHFQHTFRLSCSMIEECEKAGIPAFLTLADYWHICPPILLLQPGFALCPGPDPERCARCGNAIGALYSGSPGSGLAASPHKAARLAGTIVNAAADRAIRTAHAIKRQMPSPLVERLRAWKNARDLENPASSLNARREMIEARMETMTRALSSARMVFAPSRFLMEKTLEAGVVSPEKIIHSDYGFDPTPFQNLERTEAGHLRFGFIGTPVEHKGVHLAVQAMGLLDDANAELLVYGDMKWFPAYAKRLEKLARGRRVRFMGRFENDKVGSILSGLDALIVPSLWYENSPLTIHEAFLAGVPAIVSDVGGMAELVKDGGGLTFRIGDHRDLARVMRSLIESPRAIDDLRAGVPSVKSVRENAKELLDFYRQG